MVVRHGATEWSRAGRHTGRTDLPLLAEGERQAAELGGRLAGHHFALVLTSPLRRAADTCALAGFGTGAVVCDDLREWDYGDAEGRTTEEIRAELPGWSLWSDGAPRGERPEDVGPTVSAALTMAFQSGNAVAVLLTQKLIGAKPF